MSKGDVVPITFTVIFPEYTQQADCPAESAEPFDDVGNKLHHFRLDDA